MAITLGIGTPHSGTMEAIRSDAISSEVLPTCLSLSFASDVVSGAAVVFETSSVLSAVVVVLVEEGSIAGNFSSSSIFHPLFI